MDVKTKKDKSASDDSKEKSSARILRRSLHRIISEEEFKEPLKGNARPFFQLAGFILNDTGNFSARFYFNLMNEAEKFETFLDDYGARENNQWYYFGELIASIRNFAVAAFELSHILNRYRDYFPGDSSNSAEEFLTHGLEVTNYINNIQRDLIKEALEELKRQDCDIGKLDVSLHSFGEIDQMVKLPHNIMLEEYKTSESRIMGIAETYRKIAMRIHRERYGNRAEPEELAKMIPSRINETKVKVFENTLHNIQSEYDTHIRQTSYERSHPDLKKLRANTSVPMHLFEMARWIIHFYERHENEIHVDESRDRISQIVDKNLVLKLLSNFAFYYSHKYMMEGKPIAEKIMSKFARKGSLELPVPKPAGFHARPAYYITLIVEEHGTDVFMYVGDRKFNARSVLDLLEAGGLAADLELDTVIFKGDKRTLADLKILADNNYCEEEKVPKELNYIRVARNIMT